jgi:hypothetical protein
MRMLSFLTSWERWKAPFAMAGMVWLERHMHECRTDNGTVHLRLKAVKVALAMISGAYSTGLVSYFTHRDLFPSLMKAVQDSDDSLQNLGPFVLLGLLTNYNKFEFQNPYRLRLDDFVNDGIIRKVVQCVGATCAIARDKYVAIQEDMLEGWNFTNTLVYIGLGALTSSKPAMPTLTPEEAKARFITLLVTPGY